MKEVNEVCEPKSEIKSEVKSGIKVKEEFSVLQKQQKEEDTKDSAKSSGGCCEPVCGPFTCP